MIKITKQLALAVLKSINGALRSGGGSGIGQDVCIMQALSRGAGLNPKDDNPLECVGSGAAAFARKLNDCTWSSEEARADGFKRFGVASVGSNQLDQQEFGRLMFLKSTQQLLPFVLREIAKTKTGTYRDNLIKHADSCEAVTTFEEAKTATKNASAYAYTYAYTYAYAYAYAYASAYASASASAYASAYASASAYAYADADFKPLREKDKLLRMTAEVAVQCLVEMKSPGAKWLGVMEEEQ